MIEFIERLEAQETGSSEISDDILLKLGWKFLPPNRYQCWTDPEGTKYVSKDRPDPSRSLDDVISLIPKGIHWLVHDGNRVSPNHPKGFASLYFGKPEFAYKAREKDYVYGRASTPALAMCSALMRYHLEMKMRRLADLGQDIEQGIGKET